MTIIDELNAAESFSAMRKKVEQQGIAVTERGFTNILDRLVHISDPQQMANLGVHMVGPVQCSILVTDPSRPIGKVYIHCVEPGCFFVADNSASGNVAHLAIRMQRGGSVAFFAGIDPGILNLHDIFMRSENQWVFWGAGATAVSTALEIEGTNRGIAVGDDCMFSSETRIRNHDMHTLFEVATNQIINADPVDTIVQQHVWVGEGVTILLSPTIGFGAVAGARTLIRGSVPPMSVAVGTPHKIQREGISWCRSERDIAPPTRERLARLMAQTSKPDNASHDIPKDTSEAKINIPSSNIQSTNDYYEDDNLKIIIQGSIDSFEELILCFTGIGKGFGGIQPMEFLSVAGKENRAAMHIIDKNRTWYNSIDGNHLASMIRDVAGNRPVLSLGNSMGGFGAIWISHYVKVTQAVAFVPQFSVKPDIIPNENRWREWRDKITQWNIESLNGFFVPDTKYWTFNSPDDAEHWIRFPSYSNCNHILIENSTHDVAFAMKKSGCLQAVIENSFSGTDSVALLNANGMIARKIAIPSDQICL